MKPAYKIAANTIILYFRVFITGGISLYATRLVLDALGMEDYGIYSLVAGVVAMLAFLNSAMTVSTQRYLSYYEGRKDQEKQRSIFVNSLLLHFATGVLLLLVMEVASLFLFDGFLQISSERLYAAKVSYRMMEAAVFFSIVSVPFTASLNAHEDMFLLALIGVLEVVLRLISAVSVFYILQEDRLIYYSLFNALASFVVFACYVIICLWRYKECTFKVRKYSSRQQINELKSFMGWNLFGSLCGVCRNQGFSVVLNLFFGVMFNAAYAIAGQLGGYFSFFSGTLSQTMNPQIMKSEGNNDRKRMLRLSMTTSKLAFFLFSAIAIPCSFEIKKLLGWWLKEVPPYAEIFCVLVLAAILVNLLTVGLQSAIQATGKIKHYQATVGSLLVMALPLAFLLLWLGFPPYSILIGSIFIELIACALRLFFLKKLAGLSLREYFNRVFKKELFPFLIILSVSFFVTANFSWDSRFLLTFFLSSAFFLPSVYFIGLCADEKAMIDEMLGKIMLKLKTK